MCQDEEKIKIAGVYRQSIVDGPGIRFTIFAQGCTHDCPGCHNPDTHDFDGGYYCSIDRFIEEIDKNPLLDGVTFTGGDPVYQAEAFYNLSVKIKERNLNILIYTGFTYEELLELAKEKPVIGKLMGIIDYLIDGRFIMEERDLTLEFRGSKNQRFIDMNLTREQGKIVLY
ncbi:MAG: anaerobic ribonucleoside-triphosphate reductase activating protein [Eubacteriales bacterium]|nr:anaerobic ribonucleoside-triphosphate reductase activating protein [Eubacteriales bacterium]MDD4390145.1 anaerobic ribonucleoside-triphosphate reductase activating protein [Eubacteriales bacterium]